MKKTSILILVLALLSLSTPAAPNFKIKQLQGAWWSNLRNPTADFGIHGDQVWLDSDSRYHPCRVENDILIFELGPELGSVKNRIISIKGATMVLENLATKQRTTFTRSKR